MIAFINWNSLQNNF